MPLKVVKLLAAVLIAGCGLAASSSRPALAASCPNAGFSVVESKASPETRPVRMGKSRTVFVRRNAITTTADISEIKLAGDDDDTLIQIKFAPAAAARLHNATTDHAGIRMAFVADGAVLLAFTWEGPYGMDTDGAQLSIEHGMARARPLVEAISKCIGNGVGRAP